MVIISILVMLVRIFLIFLLAIFILLLLILLIPIRYALTLLVKGKIDMSVRVRWTFFGVELLFTGGSALFEIRVFGKLAKSGPMKAKTRSKPPKRKPMTRSPIPGRAFFQEAASFSKEIFTVLKPKELAAFGVYSLNDPADTAVASFIIAAIHACMPQAHIELAPAFETEATDMKMNISGRIMLIQLVGISLKYVFRKEVRKVLFRKRTKVKARGFSNFRRILLWKPKM